MTEWTDDGRPAEWVTEVEAEFDENERDSWYALVEHESAICPHCGNYRAICSNPEGVDGQGYHVTQAVCYVSMVRDATRRRIDRKFAKTDPDLQGFLPTDGVTFAVALVDDDSDDILSLGEQAEALLALQGPADGDQPEQH